MMPLCEMTVNDALVPAHNSKHQNRSDSILAVSDNYSRFFGSFPAIQQVTGRRPRAFSLFMKIFRDPCPVSLQVNYMKNIKTCFLRTGHVQKMYKQTGHMRAFA